MYSQRCSPWPLHLDLVRLYERRIEDLTKFTSVNTEEYVERPSILLPLRYVCIVYILVPQARARLDIGPSRRVDAAILEFAKRCKEKTRVALCNPRAKPSWPCLNSRICTASAEKGIEEMFLGMFSLKQMPLDHR